MFVFFRGTRLTDRYVKTTLHSKVSLKAQNKSFRQGFISREIKLLKVISRPCLNDCKQKRNQVVARNYACDR